MDVYHGIGARVTNDMFKAIVALADDYKNGKVDRADMMLTVADNVNYYMSGQAEAMLILEGVADEL